MFSVRCSRAALAIRESRMSAELLSGPRGGQGRAWYVMVTMAFLSFVFGLAWELEHVGIYLGKRHFVHGNGRQSSEIPLLNGTSP